MESLPSSAPKEPRRTRGRTWLFAAGVLLAADERRVPVFVHCEHGADRTGIACAAYRIVVQGWSKQQAIDEMVNGGYGFHRVWGNLIDFIRDLDVEYLKRQLKR